MMRNPWSVVSSANSNMVQWRGNLVPEKEAKALQHVFDDLHDHFGHQRLVGCALLYWREMSRQWISASMEATRSYSLL